MVEGNNEEKCSCKLNDCIASWLVFILVGGVIVFSLIFMVNDLWEAPDVQELVIKVELGDSIQNNKANSHVFYAEEIDSLIKLVKNYELQLDNKYQYLIDKQHEDDRLKTWGTMIVGVIVSLCGFWGYKSMKDLREDITKNAEKTSEITVNSYLEKKLQGKVNDALQNTYKTEVVDIIKNHVFNTLNSSEDPIVKNKVNEKIESDEFEKRLKKKINEVVVEVVNSMVIPNSSKENNDENQQPDQDIDLMMT